MTADTQPDGSRQRAVPCAAVLRASDLIWAGEYERADAVLEEHLTEDAACVDAWMAAASVAVASRRLDRALTCFRHALAADPDCYRAWLGCASVWRQKRKPGKALEALTRAERINPMGYEAQYALGHAAFGAGDFAHAEECFARAVALCPCEPSARIGLGFSRARRNDYEGAERALRSIAEDDAGYVDSLVGLAGLRLRQRRHSEALALAQTAIARNRFHRRAHIMLAAVSLRTWRFGAACRALRRAVQLTG